MSNGEIPSVNPAEAPKLPQSDHFGAKQKPMGDLAPHSGFPPPSDGSSGKLSPSQAAWMKNFNKAFANQAMTIKKFKKFMAQREKYIEAQMKREAVQARKALRKLGDISSGKQDS